MDLRRYQTLNHLFAAKYQLVINLLNAYPHFWIRFRVLCIDSLICIRIVRAQKSLVSI